MCPLPGPHIFTARVSLHCSCQVLAARTCCGIKGGEGPGQSWCVCKEHHTVALRTLGAAARRSSQHERGWGVEGVVQPVSIRSTNAPLQAAQACCHHRCTNAFL